MKTPSRESTSSATSTVSTPAVAGFVLGLDLGDRKHWPCVLDAAGTVVGEDPVPNRRPAPNPTVALGDLGQSRSAVGPGIT
jgi:hypothetical protein